ncbi:hypothetical protein LEP1GSC202_3656 [Leptospira yanagawae serovar Saopaulo str. Sao Paulo = ATCC 700523]|uniref:Uncharacterized protein n=1 Tax=Leptospira yanagawae serovar Saopaulo str. Sao Paulo = ATCC 700523 TaxID=1249483 RepID=A0A5E8H731_9LEPT|nr:hypothetical protein LEP1GSC202_3656 [Leptospira yanagawae serovar Saopaulo str. Sao Paulo = ATCC 700523]
MLSNINFFYNGFSLPEAILDNSIKANNFSTKETNLYLRSGILLILNTVFSKGKLFGFQIMNRFTD